MEKIMRWKIEITWRGGGNVREDRKEIVGDLSHIGRLLADGPAGWTTAYSCITELREHEAVSAPAAELPWQAAA
jgi:hypothetical protein